MRQTSFGPVLAMLAANPLALSGLGEVTSGDALGALVEWGAGALVVGGAYVVREGQRAERQFNERTIAKPPALPRKILGSLTIGAGVALAAGFAWPLGLVGGVAMGALGAGAGLVAFGLDPMKAKGGAGSDFDSTRVATAVVEAEALLAEITSLIAPLRDRTLTGDVDILTDATRDMIRTVESDPRDLPAARQYLGLYLRGARDATEAYTQVALARPDPAARTRYMELIHDLDGQFRAKRAMLLENDRAALDIEIDVLRHRLAQDGVRPKEKVD